jgi:hypothetical protein
MITRFLTSVSTAFSPFNPKSGKTARNFLALLPPNARTTMKIDIKQLPRADAAKPALLALKFSTAPPYPSLIRSLLTHNHRGRQRDEPRPGDVEDQGHHDRGRPTLAHARQKRRAGWLILFIAHTFNFYFALGGARRYGYQRYILYFDSTFISTNITSCLNHCIQHITRPIRPIVSAEDLRYTEYVQFLFRCL